MKRSSIVVFCFLTFLLGESIATTGKFVHHDSSSAKSELLQTQSRSMTATETSSQTATETATGTETETSCDPDCMFNYPYNEGGCKPPPEPPVNEEFITIEGEGPSETIPQPPVTVVIDEEGPIYESTYETEGSTSEEILPPPPITEEEEDTEKYEGTYDTEGSFSEEIPLLPPVIEEESNIEPYEGVYEAEGSSNEELPLLPPIVVFDEEHQIIYDDTYSTEGTFSEEVSLTPVIEEEQDMWTNSEVVIIPPEEPQSECVYTASLTSGVTHAYGQPTTYLTYTLHDDKKDQDVVYTYVLTTMYQGTVQNSENDYVVYGTGAINFYNTYYGVNDYLTDKPGCSCVCGYSSYTFSYSFDF